MRLITKENQFETAHVGPRPWQRDYLAMYSTLWPGITTDPDLMVVPADDHLVHRGDGVFEVLRCAGGRLYQWEEHHLRLQRSAEAVGLEFPDRDGELLDLVKQTVRAGGEKECLVRIILSRGPGSFTPNPFDCPQSHLYINVVRFRSVPQRFYTEGVGLCTSRIPIKKSFFANIKSCNYLPNVLMKLETAETGCEYSVALDEGGYLAEGSTENIGVVTSDGVLRLPGFERTLSGITIARVYTLAVPLVEEGLVRAVSFSKIEREQAYAAEEIFMSGTSVVLVPVVQYDNHPIGAGKPGPVYGKLSELLRSDMLQNDALLTNVF